MLQNKMAAINGITQTGKAVDRTAKAAGDLTDSSMKSLSGDRGVNSNGGIVGDLGNKVNLRDASQQFAQDHPELAKTLTGPAGPARDAAMQEFNQYAADEFGVKGPAATASYSGNALANTPQDTKTNAETGQPVQMSGLKGAYDTKNNVILINGARQDGSTTDYTTVDGHELKHALDQQLNRTTTEAGADRFGNQTADALRGEIGNGQSANLDRWNLNSPINQTNAPEYQYGNALAADAVVVDPKVNWGKYVLQNPKVKSELQKLDDNLVKMGHPDDSFIINVTGGDRYKDPNDPSRILSRTDNTPIGRSKGKSGHLESEGALAVDLVYTGITKSEFTKAWSNTDFAKGFIDDHYQEGPHTHINLPRNPVYIWKSGENK